MERYGAKRGQPVAIDRKCHGPDNGSNKPIRNRWHPTATVSERWQGGGRRFEVDHREKRDSRPVMSQTSEPLWKSIHIKSA